MCRFLLLIPLLLLVSEAVAQNERSHPTLQGDFWPDVKERGSGTLIAVYVPAEGFAWHTGIDSDGREGKPADQKKPGQEGKRTCENAHSHESKHSGKNTLFENHTPGQENKISRDNAPAHDGKLTGVTVDLLREFARYLSETYDIQLDLSFERQKHWPTFYTDIVDAGDGVIGMGNVTITEERRSELVFSPPYMTNIASLITHHNAPELIEPDHLKTTLGGRTALAFEGTLHEQRLRKLTGQYYPEASFRMAGSNDEILGLVSASDQYFAYIDLYNYWRAVERGLPLRRHESADQASEQFGYIMPLNTSWEPVLREFFEHADGITASERYHSILSDHLGENLARILLDAATH